MPQRGGRSSVRRLGHGQSHVHVLARCACLCVCFFIAKLDEIHVKFVRNWYEAPTNFVPISREWLGVNTDGYMKFVRIPYEFDVNLREFRPNCMFHWCIIPSLLPLPPLVPCTLLPACRARFTPGRRTSGTKPGGDSRRTSVCNCPSRRARWPTALVVDGPRVRPAVSTVRPLGRHCREPQRGHLRCGAWAVGCAGGGRSHAVPRGLGYRPR